jgi:hypothetical protein
MTDVTASAAGADQLRSSGKYSFKHKEARFAVGITASEGQNRHYYHGGALTGKEAYSWNAGLYAQLNMKKWALRPRFVYEQTGAKVPVDFESRTSTTLRTSGIHIPLDLLFRPFGPNSFYLLGGGYYSRILGAKQGGVEIDLAAPGAPRQDEWGLKWGIGLNIYKLWFEYNERYGLSGVYPQGGKISNRSSHFSVGYRF